MVHIVILCEVSPTSRDEDNRATIKLCPKEESQCAVQVDKTGDQHTRSSGTQSPSKHELLELCLRAFSYRKYGNFIRKVIRQNTPSLITFFNKKKGFYRTKTYKSETIGLSNS